VQPVTADVKASTAVWCDEQLSLSVIAHWCRVTVQGKPARQKLPADGHGGALFVRGTGKWSEAQRSVHAMIVDVFALKVVTGSPVIPTAGCCWKADPRWRWPGAGRWSKPCKLARNDARPKRWGGAATQHQSLGLFWARRRTASLPAGNCWRPRDHQHRGGVSVHRRWTPEAVLKLVSQSCKGGQSLQRRQAKRLVAPAPAASGCLWSSWRAVLLTSLGLACRAGVSRCTFPGSGCRNRNRKFGLLLERLPAPAVNR